MVEAKKNSWKRVYKEDGTCHYPTDDDKNLLRQKGEMYFKPMEINGYGEGTKQNPKISLWREYKNQIIPDLEKKVVERFSNGGSRKVFIVKQEDGLVHIMMENIKGE